MFKALTPGFSLATRRTRTLGPERVQIEAATEHLRTAYACYFIEQPNINMNICI